MSDHSSFPDLTPPARVKKISPNHKARQQVLTLFKALGYNPLIAMYEMATAVNSAGAPLHEPLIRVKLHAELAEYAYPKLRGIEIPVQPEQPRRPVRTFDLSRLTLEERRQMLTFVERTALVAVGVDDQPTGDGV